MPTLVREAGLSKKNLTNHCIRSTCITILDTEGYEARHIMSISGHKKEESIKSYSSKTSRAKKREISETLANAIAPCPPKKWSPPQSVNHIHTKQNCSELAQGNKRRDDDDDQPPNFDLGLADFLELGPEEEKNLLNELMSNDIPIPPGPSDQMAKPAPQNQTHCNLVNAWNPLAQMQQIMPKMVFQNSAVTINFNVGK